MILMMGERATEENIMLQPEKRLREDDPLPRNCCLHDNNGYAKDLVKNDVSSNNAEVIPIVEKRMNGHVNGVSVGDVERNDNIPGDCVSYEQGKGYWESVPATVDGVLGGFGHISNTDISGSKTFLKQFISGKKAHTGQKRAVDCGAGIGRITKHLLLPLFDTVDMVEQNKNFLDQANDYIGSDPERIGNYICCGLQDFNPHPDSYDVIWIQWVLGYLNDADVVSFFHRCREALNVNGVIIIKENLTSSGEVEQDASDGSVTRPGKLMRELIRKADLKISKEKLQTKFPKEIYEVRMFGCQKAKIK